MLLILPIQLGKIGHVRQEHIHLDHSVNAGARLLQDSADIGYAGGCFLGDAGAGGEDFAGGGGGNLAGDKDEVGGDDCLGLS